MRAYRYLCGCKNHAKIFSRSIYVSRNQNSIYRYPKMIGNEVIADPHQNTITLEDKILNSLKGKLVYNSLVTRKNEKMRWKVRWEQLRKEKEEEDPYVTPVSLKYMFEDCDLNKCADERDVAVDDDDVIVEDDESEDDVNLPYSKTQEVEIESDYDENEELMMKKELMFAYQGRNNFFGVVYEIFLSKGKLTK